MSRRPNAPKPAEALATGQRAPLPFTRSFWGWLERQPNSKKNFLLALMIGLATAAPSALERVWLYFSAPLPRVTIRCVAAAFPVRIKYGDRAIYGLELSPEWGNELQMAVARSLPDGKESLWPTDTEVLDARTGSVRTGGGVLCSLRNSSDEPLTAVKLALSVTFRKAGAPPRAPIEVTLPDPVEPFESFDFYLADDTGWDATVVLPEGVQARIGSRAVAKTIPVAYSTPKPPVFSFFLPIRLRALPSRGPSG